jgi:multiple sugar transport system substrate-binding protein
MRKWTIIMMAVLITAAISLTGCGSNQSGPDNASPSKDKSSETGATPNSGSNGDSAEPVQLTITWWGGQPRHDYTQKLLDLYTKEHPNVTFQATPSGWSGYFDKLSAQAAASSMPDIIQMDYSYLATFSKNDTLADLQPFVDNKTLDVSKIDPNLLSSGEVNGKLTAAVISSTALAVAYNPDVFKQAGLEMPKSGWTWQNFMDDMKTIQAKTGSYGTQPLSASDTANFEYWARQHGQTLYSPDGTKLGYTDDKIMADFLQMQKTLSDEKAMPNPDEWAQIASKGDQGWPLVTGKAGVTFDWANVTVRQAGLNPNLKLVTPPQDPNNTKALWIKPGMFFSIAKTSKHQEEAAKFINWFINSKEANDIIKAERGIPVSSDIRSAMKDSLTPQQQDMFNYIDEATKYSSKIDPPQPQGAAEVVKLFMDEINKVLYNMSTPDQAAAEFRQKANEILARNASK